ncbi:hypothetical protein [Salegentibacter mishustinae]|uniref:Uncharacterized protein n=1 Tax=Salegentibacter mishustinae TaxID=270918 RepID=A0A0Q9Z690_9FLAO|nr:hypothetical protein [Salegentibacter mishustinae]KRG28470.1 hypothetical protein APR42_06745 [Salegentibacter mishustinae]PNW22404.1 hypothetical protein APB85_14510 [Salegentibacter mishustinae]PZX67639.1 hypothetical protein LY54_00375 [Salegentibacter mishustinae]UBZ07493.1 hypothetical protein LDL76_02015 [Salegentibacter mishustinae]GGW78386.1 hypothetical protein GCM10008086_02400 [Salegentibacter mishustinae]
MDTSLFLAKFWGWYLLIFFFVLSFNPRRIQQIFEDLKDQKFLILAAFAAIIIGLLNILFHNIWELNWKFIITILGWTSLFIGLGLFVFPEPTTRKLAVLNLKFVQTIYVLLFLLGIFLLNMGYGLVLQ